MNESTTRKYLFQLRVPLIIFERTYCFGDELQLKLILAGFPPRKELFIGAV